MNTEYQDPIPFPHWNSNYDQHVSILVRLVLIPSVLVLSPLDHLRGGLGTGVASFTQIAVSPMDSLVPLGEA